MAGKTRKAWTPEHEAYLEENYTKTTKMSEMCEYLGRSPHQIYHAANARGLKRGRNLYELYQGDKLIAKGTKTDIAVTIGVFEEDLGAYGTPSYAKLCPDGNGRRLVLVDDKRG